MGRPLLMVANHKVANRPALAEPGLVLDVDP